MKTACRPLAANLKHVSRCKHPTWFVWDCLGWLAPLKWQCEGCGTKLASKGVNLVLLSQILKVGVCCEAYRPHLWPHGVSPKQQEFVPRSGSQHLNFWYQRNLTRHQQSRCVTTLKVMQNLPEPLLLAVSASDSCWWAPVLLYACIGICILWRLCPKLKQCQYIFEPICWCSALILADARMTHASPKNQACWLYSRSMDPPHASSQGKTKSWWQILQFCSCTQNNKSSAVLLIRSRGNNDRVLINCSEQQFIIIHQFHTDSVRTESTSDDT